MFGLERLKGKTVLITGASAGIGADTARLFAECGSNLVLCARRLGRLEALAKEIKAKHPAVEVHVTELDVSDGEAVAALLPSLPAAFADIDILVNNAGAALGMSKSWEITDAQVAGMLGANVNGIIYMQRAVLPRMLERNSGHVINVSSISGAVTYPGGGVYSATKHAVHALTHTLRQEVA
jgi:3-hydroxy acid dehydrogenase/malonic semialdehyde reductase